MTEAEEACRALGSQKPRKPDTLADAFQKKINYHMSEAERITTLLARFKADPLSIALDEIYWIVK